MIEESIISKNDKLVTQKYFDKVKEMGVSWQYMGKSDLYNGADMYLVRIDLKYIYLHVNRKTELHKIGEYKVIAQGGYVESITKDVLTGRTIKFYKFYGRKGYLLSGGNYRAIKAGLKTGAWKMEVDQCENSEN